MSDDYDLDDNINEERADGGHSAVYAAAKRTGAYDHDYAEAAIRDVLANIAHFADRCGIDPYEVFEFGLRTYEGDAEDGPKVKQVYTPDAVLGGS